MRCRSDRYKRGMRNRHFSFSLSLSLFSPSNPFFLETILALCLQTSFDFSIASVSLSVIIIIRMNGKASVSKELNAKHSKVPFFSPSFRFHHCFCVFTVTLSQPTWWEFRDCVGYNRYWKHFWSIQTIENVQIVDQSKHHNLLLLLLHDHLTKMKRALCCWIYLFTEHQDGQVWTLGYSFVCNALESIVASASTSHRSLPKLSLFNWLCWKKNIIQISDTDGFETGKVYNSGYMASRSGCFHEM